MKKFKISLSQGHYDALTIIMSEECPYADERDLSPVFEQLIEDHLERENGRLGKIVDGKWVKT